MRWIIRVGLGLAVLVLLALGLMAMVPSERVAAAVAAQFESLTGRKLVMQGELTPRLWPTLGVTTGPVSIANTDWAEDEAPLFSAERRSIDVNFGALLGGEVKITGLAADRPQVNLERSPEGETNWVFARGGNGAVPAAAPAFTLDQGRITGGSIRFNDRQAGRVIALDAVDGTLSIPDFSGPFTLTATGLSGGQNVAVDLSAGVFSAFALGRVVPVTLKLSAGGSRIGFEGRGGISPLVAEGTLEANLGDLPALGGLVGTPLAVPGPGLGQEVLTLTGKLTLDGSGALFLRGAEIVADANRLTGDLDLRPGEARPKLSAELTAGPILIGTGPEGEMGGGQAGGMQATGWPEGEIDVGALAAADAEIALTAPSI
ncbi:MAG: AsmA family protein, partial [Paracoccaceae bacterium]|nr:AsmA family protein [Paracoccaceae bacterium]